MMILRQGKNQMLALSKQSKVVDVVVNNSQSGENSYNIISWLKYIFLGVAFLILAILSGAIIYILNQKIIYKKSSSRQKILICMKKILSNLEKQGYELKQDETLKEFRIRLKKDESLVDSEILKLLEWFETVRYSKKVIAEEDVFFVEQFLLKYKLKK